MRSLKESGYDIHSPNLVALGGWGITIDREVLRWQEVLQRETQAEQRKVCPL